MPSRRGCKRSWLLLSRCSISFGYALRLPSARCHPTRCTSTLPSSTVVTHCAATTLDGSKGQVAPFRCSTHPRCSRPVQSVSFLSSVSDVVPLLSLAPPWAAPFSPGQKSCPCACFVCDGLDWLGRRWTRLPTPKPVGTCGNHFGFSLWGRTGWMRVASLASFFTCCVPSCSTQSTGCSTRRESVVSTCGSARTCQRTPCHAFTCWAS
mmetsp:Transcript_5454/g.17645  ORF Transcript_5454/g.17645 Transcript_5454/m.17645 type:complete len:208 (-) Transcript_5454:876-1499(-)